MFVKKRIINLALENQSELNALTFFDRLCTMCFFVVVIYDQIFRFVFPCNFFLILLVSLMQNVLRL